LKFDAITDLTIAESKECTVDEFRSTENRTSKNV